jgi:hypothetical protein
VNPRFALAIPHSEASHLGALRRWTGIEVCEEGPLVWVRAAHLDEHQWDFCRRLPGADRYTITDEGRRLAVGNLVPHGRLPTGPWRSLVDWLEVELPRRDESPPLPPPVSLRLVRSTIERDAGWLLTDAATWHAYASTAPQIRLACWSFAADETGAVVVRGKPLPPVPGVRLVESDGIAVPVGYAWRPAVSAALVREAFRLEKDDGILWTADGVRRRIAAGDWVRATRSAARLTRDRLAAGGGP